MAQYLSPGVYIEELAVGPHPIQGVSTSTTGMVGVTACGPTDGKPLLVTTFNDYQRTFGGFRPVPDADTMRQWGEGRGQPGGRRLVAVPAGGQGDSSTTAASSSTSSACSARRHAPRRARRSGDWWRR